MVARTSIRSLLQRGEMIWSPCVYDCVSAKVVELCGYDAILLSSVELEYAHLGIPSGAYNWEEYIWVASRIANSSNLPLIVDGENGGHSPLEVYRNCKRLAQVGVMAISIEDTKCGTMFAGYHYAHHEGYLEAERWATHVKAAVDAVQGTECMIIARTDIKGGGAAQVGAVSGNAYTLGLDEAIRRARMGVEAGAEITMVQNICHAGCEPECRRIVDEVPGYRFYPDLHATDGVPDVSLETLQAWGFHLVSNHAAMKGATKGMMDYLKTNFEKRNTVYSENDQFHDMGHIFHPFGFEEWIERDRTYLGFEERLKGRKHRWAGS